ncbi:hypothetical protein BDW74DRAFT_173437 [Aspergillus multicolor]|uniref:uncharacterized protein n=1 Tax=Aspergillus multicolor TaxID=41759 RepID=UPI003CCD2272
MAMTVKGCKRVRWQDLENLEAGLPLQDVDSASRCAQARHQAAAECKYQGVVRATWASFLSTIRRPKAAFETAGVILAIPFIIAAIVLAALVAGVLVLGVVKILIWFLLHALSVYSEAVEWLAGHDMRFMFVGG